MSDTTFQAFSKIPRLSREIVITEKIDGTNAQVFIWDHILEESTAPALARIDSCSIAAGSRNRWITTENDNYGFARWVRDNAEELIKLGPGRHYGEWWGAGIQRRYGLTEKRFSLFNVDRWFAEHNETTTEADVPPKCCHVVPVLYRGEFDTPWINTVLSDLEKSGSQAAPGFMDPEGIVIWHTAARVMFKKTIRGDDLPKGLMSAVGLEKA